MGVRYQDSSCCGTGSSSLTRTQVRPLASRNRSLTRRKSDSSTSRVTRLCSAYAVSTPRHCVWPGDSTMVTVDAILQAFCALADRSPDEDRWPDDDWSEVTLRGELKKRWNAVLDDYEGDVPTLPPKPSPPPAPRGNFEDPWAAVTPGRHFDEEPPF